MAIEVLEDYNAQASCCCPQILCPIPEEVCESLSAYFFPVGFIDAEDTAFTLYKKDGSTGVWVDSETILVEDVDPSVDGQTAASYEIDLNTFFGQSYDILYQGGFGGGGEGCLRFDPVLTDECTAVGTSNKKTYLTSSHTTGTFPDLETVYTNELATENDSEVFDVSGTETDEHVAWDAAFSATIAAWNAAHPSGPTWQEANTTHTTWQGVADTRSSWEASRDAWVAEDPGSRLPEEYAEAMSDPEPPGPGTEPPTTGIDDEPTENYPPCWFKVVSTSTWYAGYWGRNSGGSPAAPTADPSEFADWFALGDYDYPPCPGSGQTSSFGAWLSVPSMLAPGGLSSSYAETSGLTEPVSYAGWMAAVQAIIDANLTLPSDEACLGVECSSLFEKTPEPTGIPFAAEDVSISSCIARSRFHIPATWTDPVTGATVPFPGTYFKITYDILEEPDGWDDPVPTVFRSFVSEDNVLEWTGPGSGAANDPSWLLPWITLDPPTVPGTRRIVNVRFVCRENWGLGVLPQVWGEAVTLPDP